MTQEPKIRFTRPSIGDDEKRLVLECLSSEHLAGDGRFTKDCALWLETHLGCRRALVTHSCTAALEMAGLLTELVPGDEVIMPSYTFVSTANAVVLRGAVPVFVDIRPDTLNIDETLIEAAITSRTRAICVVHYGGVGCAMDVIMEIAARHDLIVIEDAAQAINATYKGRPLGTWGHFGAFSFHETKNIVSGEGGALAVNDPRFVGRAEIIWEKGTNRREFHRGVVDKYTWVDIGSSYLPSELISALLLAQLDRVDALTQARMDRWTRYHRAFAGLEQAGIVRLPQVPEDCVHNGHLYYLLVPRDHQSLLLSHLNQKGILAVFHYVPLHSAPAGRKYGRVWGEMTVTEDVAMRIVRLPLHVSLTDGEQAATINAVHEYFEECGMRP